MRISVSISAAALALLAVLASFGVLAQGGGACRRVDCSCSAGQLKQGWTDTSAGCCNKPELDRLTGRMRGLREAAEAHRSALQDALQTRDQVRDRLWGKGEGRSLQTGSIVGFGNGVLGILTAPEDVEDVYGWISTGMSIASDRMRTDSDSSPAQEWADVGTQYFSTDAFKESGFLNQAEAAMAKASAYWRETHDSIGAKAIYRTELRGPQTLLKAEHVVNIANWIGAVTAVASLWESSDTLATDLREYYSADQDVNIAQKQLDDIDTQMNTLLARIAAVRERCAGASSSRLGNFAPGLYLAAFDESAPVARRQRSAGPAGAHNNEELRKLFNDVKGLSNEIAMLRKIFSEKLLIPFSPWLSGQWKQLPPQVLIELAKDARSTVPGFNKRVSAAAVRAKDINGRLKILSPAPRTKITSRDITRSLDDA